MWKHVARGHVDVIGTDHSPFLLEEKEPYWQDMANAMPGFPGLEALLPLMLTAVNEARISLEQMITLTSENPARVFDLYPRKGTIRVDSDADLVLVDLQRVTRINTSTWHSKAHQTARVWEGYPVQGAAVVTLVRGKVVARENQITVTPGWGQFVAPLRTHLAKH
jgi:allantoinase